MSWKRIWALVLRYLYATRDPSRIVEFVFWPMIDIGFYGLIALWGGAITHTTYLVQIFVTALVLWQIIYRANFEICVNVMDEFLDQNMINLVASPLRNTEWVVSMLLSGILKSIFTLIFGAFVGWLFFKINVFSIGPTLYPFVVLCLISGWIIGFVGGGILILRGPKLQQLPWVVAMLGSLFSAMFYPVDILPKWMQWIAHSFPMSYIFQGMRMLLTEQTIPWNQLLISSLLSLFYLILSIKFFFKMFERSRLHGFKRFP
jgi:ABC-2 type transport system permease protein